MTQILDHVGQQVVIGDYVSFAGMGNKTAEYGMITGKVVKINQNEVVLERLKVTYKDHKAIISRKQVRKGLGKFVKVNVPNKIHTWFSQPTFNAFDSTQIALWLNHGVW